MAQNVTLSSLRASVRFDGDCVSTRVFSDARVDYAINQACRRVWNLLIRCRPSHCVRTQTPSTTANVDTVALAAAFMKIRHIDVLDGDYYPLFPFNLSEQWRFRNVSQPRGLRYCPVEQNIVIAPTPTAVWSLRIRYFPAFTALVADGDTFDGINGFEDLVIADAVCRLKRRESMPHQEWITERDRMIKEVEDNAEVDDGEPFYLSGHGPNDIDDELLVVP